MSSHTSVQARALINQGPGSSQAVQWDNDTTTGHAALVCVFWLSDVTITSITDSQGNTYVDCGAGRIARPTDGYMQMFGAKNIAGGVRPTITVNFSGSASVIDTYLVELHNIHATTMFGAFASGAATSGTALTTGTFTPSYSAGIIIAFGVSNDTEGLVGAIAGTTARKILAPAGWATCIEELPYVSSLGSNITAAVNMSAALTKGVIIACELQAATQQPASKCVLSTTPQGRFAVNGVQEFLMGVTYFDALDWWLSDLNAMWRNGYNLMRILLDKQWDDGGTGTESVFNANGTIRPERMARIHALIEMADARGIIVEVAILVADGEPSSEDWITGVTDRATACTNAVAQLKQHVNVLYDAVNEYNYDPAFNDEATELDPLIDAVVAEDATAVVGASGAGSIAAAANEQYLTYDDNNLIPADFTPHLALQVNCFIYHAGRQPYWWAATGHRANLIKGHLNSLGRSELPVYLNEEARVGSAEVDPTGTQHIQAALNAASSNCAGYIFHTGGNFNMASATWVSQLTAEELIAFNRIGFEVQAARAARPSYTNFPKPSMRGANAATTY